MGLVQVQVAGPNRGSRHLPKAKMPPSLATSQYPAPSAVEAIPTMGWVQVQRASRTVEAGVTEG